ncbi:MULTISPECIES: rRNA maturation RNase YbeY [Tenacibaculum]|uniref:Endoribonuclease YbeY n=3 Tax=Tenacibaculum TaxID=104267 RepID=A0A2H1YK94_9FLAO|nr:MULTISPECIES: rRNA maturation RNase YbeY [Tenacibaculum]ALU73782.1 rRNA maturation factor [Tenacibaculum dicentrarchi]MBE7629307.1 rRNA maturation RNase YbeY [Tenacibaculum piscium]MBE7633534.1 rRNA maturation RNase YbeY [Tenacibaculum finnmarkense genomovar ulcerans]MBE7645174.1 rRNA maturation RNase YbeY [Tenacibaculum finnmarkense genomovar ulcerans]MBE7647328.1 rRNA maturation RNase YbeY [Tenacibaculum finnmarkense genomovar ulcerans]
MIEFNYETDFQLKNEEKTAQWVLNCIEKEGFELGEINYVFCDDTYLHKMNVEFLQHDTLTDIISFDYTLGKLVGGDIFISIERVKENAKEFDVLFENELHRVIIHGVLHYMKYKDKTDQEKQLMRTKENDSLKLLNLN